jgi:hypothetical protein
MIRLDADTRAELRDLKRRERQLTAPAKAAAKKVRKAKGRERESRGGKVEGQRQPRETDPGFLAYLRRQPCEAAHLGGCSGPIHAAHIRYADAARGAREPGMQRKNHDRFANPLCEHHHLYDQHQRSERAFWESLGKDAYERAEAHFSSYRGEVR